MKLFKRGEARRQSEGDGSGVGFGSCAEVRPAQTEMDRRATDLSRWATYDTEEEPAAVEPAFDVSNYLASGDYAAALAKYNGRAVGRTAPRRAVSTMSRAIPQTLYRHFDQHGRLLYVGITQRQDRRATEHSSKPWWRQVTNSTYEHFASRDEVVEAERRAIRDEQPRYNKQHRT